jgi:hypothetical protein
MIEWTAEKRAVAEQYLVKKYGDLPYVHDSIELKIGSEDLIQMQLELNEARRLLGSHPSVAGYTDVDVRNQWRAEVSEWVKRNKHD